MKRRTVITMALPATALCIWLIVYLCTAGADSRFTVVSNGPLDIRLWGIRPDAGDTIYDPNGVEIRDTVGTMWSDSPYWGEDRQCFDFLFELPADGDSGRFRRMPEMAVSGCNHHLGGSFRQSYFDYRGKKLLCFRATFGRTFKRSVLRGFWVSDTAFDSIDIALRYEHGSIESPGFVLKGLFEPNSTVSSPDGMLEFDFAESENCRGRRDSSIVVRAPEYWDEKEPIMIYDSSGNICAAITGTIRGNSLSDGIGFGVEGRPLDRISAIAFAKSAYRVVFQNVNLNVSGRKRRPHADWLFEMGERLGLAGTGKELAEYKLQSEAEVLDVIDVVRGRSLVQSIGTLRGLSRGGRIRLDAFTDEQVARLRRALSRCIEAVDPRIRALGVELGLMCKWPEFLDAGLDLLERPAAGAYESTREARSIVASALQRSVDELSDEQICRVARVLSVERWIGIRQTLRKLIQRLDVGDQVDEYLDWAD